LVREFRTKQAFLRATPGRESSADASAEVADLGGCHRHIGRVADQARLAICTRLALTILDE
jgi:hypothetical protein